MDTEMEDLDSQLDASDTLPLSDKEKTILELYDRLLDLEVELALYRARQAFTLDEDEQVSQADIRAAQSRLLDARASWMLRNDVVSSVMSVNPLIDAVHKGDDAGPIERDLLPHIISRDEISTTISSQHVEKQQVTDELTNVQVEAILSSQRNVELAAEVLSLADQANRDKDSLAQLEDPELKEEMARLEREVKASRQRWKVMKGTASAVVVGSGVDWVRDDELRGMVLDPD